MNILFVNRKYVLVKFIKIRKMIGVGGVVVGFKLCIRKYEIRFYK